MSKTLSEAERLLNTIVSSRIRLASLRGEPAPPSEPLHSELTVSDRPMPEPEGSPLENDFRTRASPQPAPPVHGRTEQATRAAEVRTPPESTPPDPMPPEPTPSLILGIPNGEEDLADDPLFEASIFDDVEQCSPSNKTADGEAPDHADPFSFIDLIPEANAATRNENRTPTPPLDTPPPVRPPAMPLPTALAVGAPRVERFPGPPSTTSERVEPDSKEPETEPIEVIESPRTHELAQPRAVAPQLLDPERERLDVEVFTAPSERDPWLPDIPSGPTPRLTEPKDAPAPAFSRQDIQPDEAVSDALSHAHHAFRRGALGDAYAHLTDVLDWSPDHLEARLMRGRCARDQGDTTAALSDFTRAMLSAPHSPLPHVDLGDLSFATKDYAQAIDHYTAAIDREPDHAMALCRRGICHHYRRRPDLALGDLESAARIDPDIANINRYIRMVARPSR